MDTSRARLPADAMTRLNELEPGEPGSTYTSDLSVDEFILVREAGFQPLGLVLGSSIYHVGVQPREWSVNQELTTLSDAMYHARELAMNRMTAEAEALYADGIVGVRLQVDLRDRNVAEFVATGTAVQADDGHWRTDHGRPFTSALSGQDFWTLLRAGYLPLGLVMGSCVYHVAHRSPRDVVSNLGANTELPTLTQAVYAARELAMERMQREAEALHAEGVVGVRLSQHNHTWGSHTTEFFAVGTAVRPIRDDHTIPRPQVVLGLDR